MGSFWWELVKKNRQTNEAGLETEEQRVGLKIEQQRNKDLDLTPTIGSVGGIKQQPGHPCWKKLQNKIGRNYPGYNMEW